MTEPHDDFATEPIPGLPAYLPEGESILWQGAPAWWRLTREVYHVQAVGLYFLGLMAWRACDRYQESGDWRLALLSFGSLVPIAAAGLALLALLGYLSSTTTLYTITNRRVVIRSGIVLTASVNLPFKLIGAAGLRLHADGTGDLPLTIGGPDRVLYNSLWPNVRPFHLKRPVPMLRAIPDARRVTALLGEALRRALPETAVLLPVAGAETVPREVRPARPPLGLPA